MQNCDCAEGLTERTVGRMNNDEKRRIFAETSAPTGLNQHDCEYIAARNAVLDQAERIALTHTEPNSQGRIERHGPGWQKAFSQAVNDLSRGNHGE
jgi:hypothetical protein